MAQLIFCGGLFALAGRAVLEQASWLLPARFGYAAGAATIGMQPSDAPDADPLFDPTAHQWLIDMGGMALQTAVFVAVAAVLLSRSVLRTGPR